MNFCVPPWVFDGYDTVPYRYILCEDGVYRKALDMPILEFWKQKSLIAEYGENKAHNEIMENPEMFGKKKSTASLGYSRMETTDGGFVINGIKYDAEGLPLPDQD